MNNVKASYLRMDDGLPYYPSAHIPRAIHTSPKEVVDYSHGYTT